MNAGETARDYKKRVKDLEAKFELLKTYARTIADGLVRVTPENGRQILMNDWRAFCHALDALDNPPEETEKDDE